MNGNYDQSLAKKLHYSIENELDRLGLLFRVFSRTKTEKSINDKISSKGIDYYSNQGKKIQDLFGIRVILYFPDDLKISQRALQKMYQCLSKEVDTPDSSLFSATRCNYTFKLPDSIIRDCQTIKNNSLIDTTFEVQFRTILSEGWHEVEHDLRYKCKDDWNKHDDLFRAFNGIFASLETSEWGIMSLFEQLAHRHYKNNEWAPMLRNKLRLRTGNELNSNLKEILSSDSVGKNFYRLNRTKLLLTILNKGLQIPININNIIYISNYYFIKDSRISDITPFVLKRILDEAQ